MDIKQHISGIIKDLNVPVITSHISEAEALSNQTIKQHLPLIAKVKCLENIHTVPVPFIIINHKRIEEKDRNAFFHLLKKDFVGVPVVFNECFFLTDLIDTEDGAIHNSVIFLNCKFCENTNVVFGKKAEGQVIFYGCRFRGNIEFSNTFFHKGLAISTCHLEGCSTLSLRDITIAKDDDANFTLRDSMIIGDFRMKNASIQAPTVLSNIHFSGSYDMSGVSFAGFKDFHNVSVYKSGKIEKENLYNFCKSLDDSGYIQFAKLLDETYIGDEGKELLTQKEAAEFIKRSVSFLKQQRYNGEMQLNEDFIPYIGKDRGLRYPKKCLIAFNAKNWKLLCQYKIEYDFQQNPTKE